MLLIGQRHMKRTALALVALLAIGGVFSSGPGASATVVPPTAVTKVATPSLTPTQIALIQTKLAASKRFTRSVVTAGGVRTSTYTYNKGGTLVFSQAVKGQHPSLVSSLSVGTCYLALCVYLTRTDQAAVRAGGSVAIAAAMCSIGVPCVLAGIVVAVANVYLAHRGWCAHYLSVNFFPSIGNAHCVLRP